MLATIKLQTNLAHAQGTAFTYQGRLNNGTKVATGSYDLRFALFDAARAGVQQGNLLMNSAVGNASEILKSFQREELLSKFSFGN